MKQVFSLLILGVLFTPTKAVYPQATSTSMSFSTPHQQLETLARRATVGDPQSIEDLTSAVVHYPHSCRIPAPVSSLMEFEISRAETAYRSRLGPGISETQILKFMNSLAVQFKLPRYAQVTQAQLRTLRMTLVVQSPYLMASGLTEPKMKLGENIDSVMSPLQALYLIQTMIDQKILNPDYQDQSIDLVTRERANREQLKAQMQPGAKHGIVRTTNPKHLEMRTALSAAVDSMSVEDGYVVLEQALTAMKLK
jgi:hypothetical protein